VAVLPLERGTDSCLLLLFSAHSASAWTEFISLPRLFKHFLHPLVFPSVLVWIFSPTSMEVAKESNAFGENKLGRLHHSSGYWRSVRTADTHLSSILP